VLFIPVFAFYTWDLSRVPQREENLGGIASRFYYFSIGDEVKDKEKR